MTIAEIIAMLVAIGKPGALLDIQLASGQCYQIADVIDPDDGGDVIFICATQAGYKQS